MRRSAVQIFVLRKFKPFDSFFRSLVLHSYLFNYFNYLRYLLHLVLQKNII